MEKIFEKLFGKANAGEERVSRSPDLAEDSPEGEVRAEGRRALCMNAVEDRYRDPYVNWTGHPLTGRILENFTVTLDWEELVFRFDGTSDGCLEKCNRDYLSDFLRLGSLVTYKKGYSLNEIERRYLFNITEVDIPDHSWPDDVEYDEPSAKDIEELAKEFGPLFGIPDDDLTQRVIREPISAWVQAAKIANFAIRAEAFISDPAQCEGRLDGDLAWTMLVGDNSGIAIVVSKSFSPNMFKKYRRIVNREGRDKEVDQYAPKIIGGGGILYPSWINVEDSCRIEARWIKADKDERFHLVRKLDGTMLRKVDPHVDDRVMNTEQTLVEQLLQCLISVHVQRGGIDWSPSVRKGRMYGVLDVSFRTYLERLWYSFGQQHSAAKFGICEHCGRLFSAEHERKDKKRFCSSECQNRAKAKRNREKRK